jgi:hypothetical protein
MLGTSCAKKRQKMLDPQRKMAPFERLELAVLTALRKTMYKQTIELVR